MFVVLMLQVFNYYIAKMTRSLVTWTIYTPVSYYLYGYIRILFFTVKTQIPICNVLLLKYSYKSHNALTINIALKMPKRIKCNHSL